MRVLHLACVAPPEIGGIGQVAYDEMKGLRERGVEATLVSVEASHPFAQDPAMVRLPAVLRVGNAALVRGLDSYLEAADIIHLHYPWYGVAERVLWRAPAKPTVVTFHMDATAGDWRGGLFSLHRHFAQSFLLKHATKVLVSSQDYAEHSSLRSLVAELGDRLVELPFGVDTEFFCPGTSLQTAEGSQRTVLFVGGLDRAHSFKGLFELLHAMVRLPEAVSLQIIGDGDQRLSFEERVHRLGLTKRVRFLGRVDRDGLRQAYQEADVLAFPSTSAAEAFGLVALEAQASGIPVVASRLPGVRTVVLDQETGILVEPGNVVELAHALERILADSSLRESLGEAARARVLERYSQKRHVDDLLEMYQTLCPR